MNIFNYREIATGIWLIIILIFILLKIKTSIKGLIKSFLHYKILIPIFLMLLYISAIIYILFLVNFWDLYLLKDSIIWVFLIGFLIFFKYSTLDKYENFLKKIFLDNIKLIIIFEFIVNIYTFPLYIEIILVPLISFIVLLDVVASYSSKYIIVSKILDIIQIIIGLSVLSYSIYKIVLDFKNFATLNTLKDFLLAPILTLSIIPFIYCFILYINYENIFKRLDLGVKKDKKLKKYAKKQIIKYCSLKISKVKKILSSKANELMRISNEKDVDFLIEILKSQDN